ncbi:MAG: PHP domain-containing protein, partial [Candidatus Nanohalobium sp.]
MDFDLHTHTTYSDGSFMHMMASAAQQAGLKEIGFADHANVSKRKAMVQTKYNNGFNLDQTYERRIKAIKALRQKKDIKIYNAVEMDYDPRDEKQIKKFLSEKNFDYTLGSVHNLENTNVHIRDYFKNKTKKSREKLVQQYFEKLEKLIRSELFDIASHIDVFERNPQFQGFATR